ncbi:MAG TPA: Calx-beta domain-containing protein, partial [Pyrinomonadaceae bacterium]|nr:Calx-beta domain-containing protein [Pyrinomonadaceae bacterium]
MSKKMRLPLAILITTLALTVCSSAANAQTFTITVQINDGTVQGPPIPAVNVQLVMNSTTTFNAQTDNNGTCSFPGISGEYNVTPSKAGYTFNPTAQGGTNTGPRTLFFTGASSSGQTLQFNAPTYSAGEGGGKVSVTVVRAGSTAGEASVSYATSDTAGLTNCNVFNGIASSRCDYAVSVGRLNFVAGEAFKTISIPLVDDSYAEGSENFSIALSNPSGGTLGVSNATITISDNETSTGPNPIFVTAFFVRQHYIDFLGREPDP